MRIVSFYSFKGGVGRTLALVNIAFQLVSEGKRVLIVDFDLEAPGLRTFVDLESTSESGGIVDYVQNFLFKGHAPSVMEYVSPTAFSDRLLLLDTGLQDRNYPSRMNHLNWSKLYEEQDGYLLFEDLKAQWEQKLVADYVLMDSRSGYTDTSGICTRHLPDAVALFFYPNSQNLTGLKQIVAGIQNEAKTIRQKHIQMHFVMSNVPFLDDEEEILSEVRNEFKDQFEIGDIHTIHRYESPLHLNQSVYTIDRPKSRLAREYRELRKKIA